MRLVRASAAATAQLCSPLHCGPRQQYFNFPSYTRVHWSAVGLESEGGTGVATSAGPARGPAPPGRWALMLKLGHTEWSRQTKLEIGIFCIGPGWQ